MKIVKNSDLGKCEDAEKIILFEMIKILFELYV
jgi:hypothetical protein